MNDQEQFHDDFKKREKRIKIPCQIRYRPVLDEEEFGGWDISEAIVNISKTGVCFFTSKQFNPGDELEIALSSFLFPYESVCRGRVVWSQRYHQARSIFETAVEIHWVQEDNAEVFLKAIEEFQKGQS